MCRNSHSRASGNRQRGFSIVTAVFLVVVLALLGAFIVSVTGLQQKSAQIDVQGVRAYQAARAGIEWAAFQILTPSGSTPPACPAASTDIGTLAGSLSAFTVTVACTVTADTTEGNRNVKTYSLVATACNEPVVSSCLATGNPSPSPNYVDRQLVVVLSRCNDPTAAPPRFACG
ncbi:MAG: agglutinin biogenesis protein MshP [Betaproteobacteria bacterium]|nr:agglutinin biogenesis protein MshP [Betaproteobacteria bacterium]